MTYASTRTQILYALTDRIKTITAAAGYPQTIKSVFVDEIPLGMDLAPHQMPAVIVMDDTDLFAHQHQVLECAWTIELQLILEKCKDSVVHELIRSVAKAIFAGGPTEESNGGFRFHPAVSWVQLSAVHSDLNMIKANRLASMEIIVHYRAKPYDL